MQDDFGDEVNRCRYTDELIWPDQARVVGATIPGVKARYFISKSPDAIALHKAQGIAFHESEANCNMCACLIRHVKPKQKDGFLHGACEVSAWRMFKFHPDDPMHMECYVSRWEQIAATL